MDEYRKDFREARSEYFWSLPRVVAALSDEGSCPMTAPIPQPQPMSDLVKQLRQKAKWRDNDVHGDLHNAAADHIEGLEAALRDMVNTFQPFTMKPVGAPNSAARLGQEHQIEVHRRARSALQPKGAA